MKKLIGANLSGIIWGGQVDHLAINLLTLEIIALLVTLIFTAIIAAKMDYIKAGKFKRAINIGVWALFVYLILNTLGNLISGISFENLVFAPISLMLAICALRLAVEK